MVAMNLYLRIAVVAFCVFSNVTSFAAEVKNIRIDSLAEVLVEVRSLLQDHSANELVFLADWDDFLTSENGGNSPREELTSEVLGQISALIRVGVLTARGNGSPEFSSFASHVTKAMHEGLFNLSPKQKNPLTVNPAFVPGPFEFRGATIEEKPSENPAETSPARIVLSDKKHWIKFPPSPLKMPRESTKTHPVFTVMNNIAFVGNPIFGQMTKGSMKGIAATTFLDQGYFSGNKPSVILFGDNDLENLQAMERAFENRPEKLVLFYFPVKKAIPFFLSAFPSVEYGLTDLWGDDEVDVPSPEMNSENSDSLESAESNHKKARIGE